MNTPVRLGGDIRGEISLRVPHSLKAAGSEEYAHRVY